MDEQLFKQYQEGLITLVEKNQDKNWMPAFIDMRNGGFLPQGGAGSLNDWGPIYLDIYQSSWYNCLYDILMELYRKRLTPAHINEHRTIKNRHTSEILMCSNCQQKFQHPNIFERLIATEHLAEHLEDLISSLSIESIFKPSNSFESDYANKYRASLNQAYKKEGILLYNFVKNKYKCPTCQQKMDLTHIKYGIKRNLFNGKTKLNKK